MASSDYTSKNMSIKNYYQDKEIFITGGSGFIGKALIEKILRSCSGFAKMYVLLRNKKGKNAAQRLEDLLQEKIFKRARCERPESFKKVFPIVGDCTELGLGLKPDDLKRLENVQIIFHSAASVRFDDPLRSAVLLNTRGTWELLKIAENLKKLEVFTHVSTAYCNSEQNVVEEKVYKPFADWRQTINIAESVDQATLDALYKKYSDFKPNTYTFTKALSEQIVEDYRDKVPGVVFRPSIVINCLDDPLPGWIDNFNGPSGMLMACGTGLLRSFNSDGLPKMSIIPVDIVIRGMIICAYKKGIESKTKTVAANPNNALDVYNCTIDSVAPISSYDLVEMGRICIIDNPFEKTLWLPGGVFTRCQYLYYLRIIALHILPAILLDILIRFTGREPLILKVHRKIHYAVNAVRYFITNEWDFKVENFFGLDKLVSQTEYNEFAFLDKSHLKYDHYVRLGISGGKEFLLKEKPYSSPGARFRLKVLRILHYVTLTTAYLLFARFVLKWGLRKIHEFNF